MDIENSILLFDGDCNLCNGSVRFVLKRDKKKQFSYVPLQSEDGKSLLDKFQVSGETDSIVFIKDDKIWIESDAILEICKLLPFPWSLVRVVRILPKNWRDKLYHWVAKNRYRWFGKSKATCHFNEG